MPQLQNISNEFYANSARDSIIRRIPSPGYTPLFKQVYDAFTAVRNKQKVTAEKRAEIEEAYKEPEPTLDREMLKFFLKAMSELPENQKIPVVENLFTRFKGKERREAEESFAERVVENKDFDSAEEVIKLYDKDYNDLQKKYPDVTSFIAFLADERGKYTARAGKYGGDIDRLRLLYIQGMAEMNNTLVYPDANLTLRFTYRERQRLFAARSRSIYAIYYFERRSGKRHGRFPVRRAGKIADFAETHKISADTVSAIQFRLIFSRQPILSAEIPAVRL